MKAAAWPLRPHYWPEIAAAAVALDLAAPDWCSTDLDDPRADCRTWSARAVTDTDSGRHSDQHSTDESNIAPDWDYR